jgi:GNAT superfamily N-acetyltransferase
MTRQPCRLLLGARRDQSQLEPRSSILRSVDLSDPSHETEEQMLQRLDTLQQRSNLAFWRAARAAGCQVRIVAEGELAMAAAPAMPGPAFNQANGRQDLAELIPRVLTFFRREGTPGWLATSQPPWPGARPDHTLSVLVAAPEAVPEAEPPRGVVIRRAGPEDSGRIQAILEESAAGDTNGQHAGIVAAVPAFIGTPGVVAFLAEEQGRGIATANLHVDEDAGLLRGATVIPSARGRGLQRALISARARLAVQQGCDIVVSSAAPDAISERNLLSMGLQRVGQRVFYRFDPAAEGPATEDAGQRGQPVGS